MYCTYCHYTSFDYLPSCPKCGRDWTETKKNLNLDWVVASAFETKYQRQVSSAPEDFTFAASGSSREEAAASSSPNASHPEEQTQASFQSQTLDPDYEDISFPELDDLLQSTPAPEAESRTEPSADPQPPTSRPEEPRPEPAQSQADDEALDLSDLVYDLDLELSSDSRTDQNSKPADDSQKPG